MLVLSTSNFQGATTRWIVSKHSLDTSVFVLCSPLNFLPMPVQKSYWFIFNIFRWNAWKPNVIFKRKQTKKHLNPFQLLIFYKPSCLQKYFHGWLLSIWVFSSDKHYGLIASLCRWALSHQASNLNR